MCTDRYGVYRPSGAAQNMPQLSRRGTSSISSSNTCSARTSKRNRNSSTSTNTNARQPRVTRKPSLRIVCLCSDRSRLVTTSSTWPRKRARHKSMPANFTEKLVATERRLDAVTKSVADLVVCEANATPPRGLLSSTRYTLETCTFVCSIFVVADTWPSKMKNLGTGGAERLSAAVLPCHSDLPCDGHHR